MRLLIATGLYPPEIGGPATYAKLLEDHLPGLGITVSVLPFSRVRHLPSIVRHLAYTARLVKLAHEADLILVQDTVSTGLPTLLAAAITGKRFVVRVPGDYAWEQGTARFGVNESLEAFQKNSHGARVGLLRFVQRLVVNHAYRIIAPSHYLAEIVRGWLKEPKTIEVIYNGVDISALSRGSERERNLIVSAGRLVSWKGFEALIDIVAHEREWRLAILGDGPLRKHFEEKVQSLNVGDRIALLGNVPHEEMHTWFSRASVFVLNSRYEGLSHTLIEACAAGAPIIATRVGGNPEVIRDDEDGMLIDVGNTSALERSLVVLFHDEALRKKFEVAARERAEHFSIQRTISATAALLQSCVS